ncbi:MAG TPA: sigma 54-interacting transcriptional regulator [Polyangiaceae bacterium]|jgi:transcriptional regulator with GAF, ATPase, and Fis domain
MSESANTTSPATSQVGEPGAELETCDVVVLDGSDRGTRVSIPAGGLRIGTAAGNHLQLHDTTVSRIHCELRLRRGCVQLMDAGSTNGSIANGVRVRDADLYPGATVRVGATTLRLQASDERLSIPLSPRTQLGEMVGASAEMRRIYAVIERVAPTMATVLVRGETGTGKELVARAVHSLSARADKPLVPVDCAAIAPNLIESELFGHVRGAFTGAVGERRGLFEEADGGTLFLDELAELPLAAQAKLLRVLESGEIRRVGANTPRKVDVRVIAATNRPLAPEVNHGSFREDLFYRLAVVEIELPPLRARREDVPMLAQHFYERFTGRPGPIPLDLLASLPTRSWSGNVRELRNFIERSLSLGLGEGGAQGAPLAVPLPGLDAFVPHDRPMLEARQAWVDQFESAYVRALLQRTNGNVTHAAKEARVSRRFLQSVMRRLGLRDADDEGGEEEG